ADQHPARRRQPCFRRDCLLQRLRAPRGYRRPHLVPPPVRIDRPGHGQQVLPALVAGPGVAPHQRPVVEDTAQFLTQPAVRRPRPPPRPPPPPGHGPPPPTPACRNRRTYSASAPPKSNF